MSHLQINGVRLSYGDQTILDDIDLDVGEGEMHVLLGPSGCGKTTLLRSIAGLSTPDAGTIALAGRSIERLSPKERNVGMVFQHYALFPNMTVRQNLSFGLEHRRWDKAKINAKVDSLLETVSLTDRADMRPNQLSGGQRQRVALARALALEPKLLLLDEPLSALDAQIRKRLRDELKRIQRDIGLTSVLVTHDQDEALTLGDRISVMSSGKIAQTGTGAALYHQPSNLFVAKFIGDANIFEPQEFSRITGNPSSRTAVIQPHALKIGGRKAPGASEMSGTVTLTSVAGPTVRYLVDIGGITVKVQHQTETDTEYLQPGSETKLWIASKDIHLI